MQGLIQLLIFDLKNILLGNRQSHWAKTLQLQCCVDYKPLLIPSETFLTYSFAYSMFHCLQQINMERKEFMKKLLIKHSYYSFTLFLESFIWTPLLRKVLYWELRGTNYFTEVSFSSDLEKIVSEMLKLKDHLLSVCFTNKHELPMSIYLLFSMLLSVSALLISKRWRKVWESLTKHVSYQLATLTG